jgi:hypothetical protein
MQIHLVDGTYELFRAYYGAPEATAPDGHEYRGEGLIHSDEAVCNVISDSVPYTLGSITRRFR